jgi:hypothetical protein
MRGFTLLSLSLLLSLLSLSPTDAATQPQSSRSLTHSHVQTHCRLPDIHAATLPGTTRKFVEYCPEEAWPRGVGNTLVYFPVVYWFAVFTGRDVAVTDLSSVGSVCRIFNCGFPFTSEVIKMFPDIKLSYSPRKVNYDLMLHFGGKLVKHNIVNLNGFSATALPGLLGSAANSSECVSRLTGCSRKNYTCIEHFAMRHHFPGGFRNERMLPEQVEGLSPQSLKAKVFSPPKQQLTTDLQLPVPLSPTPKVYDVGIHIRAQLKSLETKARNITISEADFNLYNKTIFPKFNDYLTKKFYSNAEVPVSSPPRIFVSVDDITLKWLLVEHLLHYRDPLQPVHVTYVNNSKPIKHAKHMRMKANITEGIFPSDQEMVPTMFDWQSLSEAEFLMAYR